MHILARMVLLSLVLTVPPILAAPQDEDEIKQVESRWQDAWNRHDMDALAALFTKDADFVQVNGRRWVGTEEIRKNHAAVHAMMFKDSVWKNSDTDIRFLSPSIAIVHTTWTLSGDRNPDGSPRQPRDGIFTQLLQKLDGKWLIAASHNTNIVIVPGSPVAGSAPGK
jgi:uncharacterized protein (TIGR02246 family)